MKTKKNNETDDNASSAAVKNELGVDLAALTRKIYALFQQELRLERERGRARTRLGG